MKYLFNICFTLLTAFATLAQQEKTESLIEKANNSIAKQDYKTAQIYFDSVITIIELIDPTQLVNYQEHAGKQFREVRQFELAEGYYNAALANKDKVTDSLALVDLYNERGLWNYDQSRYSQALLELSKSLEIGIQQQDTIGQFIAKINIGNVFKDINDHELALMYYQQALQLAETYPSFAVKCLNNIGTIYIEQNNLELAKTQLEKVLSTSMDNDFEDAKIDAFINLGIIDKMQDQTTSATIWFEKALINEGLTPLKRLLCLINLFDIALQEKYESKASILELQALNLSDSVQEITSQIELYQLLILYNDYKGDTEKAYKFQSDLLEIKDTLYSHESNIHTQQLKADLVYNQALEQLSLLGNELEIEVAKKYEITVENEQLSQTNMIITILATVCIVLLLLLIVILFVNYRKSKAFNSSLQEKATTLAIQNEKIINSKEYANSMEKLLVQQMNPHFIFNCLTIIEAGISVGELDYAKHYLKGFSSLLRQTLNYSRSTSIPLIEEIQYLKSYIELNQLNLKDSFEFEFIYDEYEVNDFVNTPPMLVQPFVENAILHGLYHKTGGFKKLTIAVVAEEHFVCWTITDNGIGREKAATINKSHASVSHGTKITSDRIKWMQNIYKQQLSFEYFDLEEGTKVVLKTPIIVS